LRVFIDQEWPIASRHASDRFAAVRTGVSRTRDKDPEKSRAPAHAGAWTTAAM
jgi:hypothetical protein